MTVCVGIVVRQCVVFAADSAITVTAGTAPSGTASVVNIWNHGNKVFNLRRNLPIVGMTAGMASFGSIPISVLAKELRRELTEGSNRLEEASYTIEEVANKANDFFFVHYFNEKPPEPNEFSFWVGGYGSSDTLGEIWSIHFENGKQKPVKRIQQLPGQVLALGGQSDAIFRLMTGFDLSIGNALAANGVDPDIITNAALPAFNPLVNPTMPVQDAINLADFMVDLTKKYLAFSPGSNSVAGETDIAVVTRHERFKWIRRKHHYPLNLNPLETDHV